MTEKFEIIPFADISAWEKNKMYHVTLIREFTQSRAQDKAIEFIKRRVLSSKPHGK